MNDDRDTALYIKHNNREWAVWLSPQDEMFSIPGDEVEATHTELVTLHKYLYDEGFFSEHFKRRLDILNNL
jgi:hypothetical protein